MSNEPTKDPFGIPFNHDYPPEVRLAKRLTDAIVAKAYELYMEAVYEESQVMATNKPQITAEQFQAATGVAPIQDDLERCNCPLAGQLGHWQCGWNVEHNLPNFMIFITARKKE